MTRQSICVFVFLFAISVGCGAAAVYAATPPAYETQTWEPGRQLVWARPGQDGSLSEPGNWRDPAGKPAAAAPDRHTDILLPAASKPYTVNGGRTDQVRHVTVEPNGTLSGRHRNEVEIWGNARLKKGGFARFVSVRGDKHTFFKVDDTEFPSPENGKIANHPSRHINIQQRCGGHLAHKLQICKYGAASVEFLGKFSISDEIMVQHGKLIVNGELRWSGATGKGALEIYDGGILELQSGARVAPFVPDNRKCVYNVNIYRNGVLQAGSPERPLTGDAYLLLGFAENDKPGRTGLYAALGSMMRVYTTDPQKARLVITATSSDPDFCDGSGKRTGDPERAAQENTGIALQLAGDIQLNGVHFDYVSQGGIGLAGARQPDAWSHVTWGAHNAAEPTGLFGKLAVDPNSYYHGRGDQKSEWGLTTRAVAQMQEYLEETDPFRITASPANTIIKKVGNKGSAIDTPVAVVFDRPVEVTISTRVPGAKLRYALDGSEPTKTSPVYEGPIRLERTTKLAVKAYQPGVGFSPVFTTTYVIK